MCCLKNLFLAVAICYSTAVAQWTRTTGPYGGSVRCFAVNDSYVFAGTESGGIFRRPVYGVDWISTSSSIGNTTINALAASGSRIFAGTGSGLFRTVDNGNSWQRLLESVGQVNSIAVSGTMMCIGTGTGAYLSTDMGGAWSNISTGLPSGSIQAVGFSGTNIVAGTATGFDVSADSGKVWAHYQWIGFQASAFTMAGQKLLAATTYGIWQSTNYGFSWALVKNGIRVYGIAFNGTHCFAATSTGVLRSADFGATWVPVNAGISATAALSITAYSTTVLAGTAGAGVFSSQDNGANWAPQSRGLAAAHVFCLAADATKLVAGGEKGSLSVTSDAGENWSAVNADFHASDVFSVLSGGSLLFAGTFWGEIFRSTDLGINWERVYFSSNPRPVRAFLSAAGKIWAATTMGGILATTDNGTSWVEKNSNISGDVRVLAAGGGRLFAGVWNGGIFISSDAGETWVEANNGITDGYITGLAVIGDTVLAGSSNGIFRSTNLGNSWVHTVSSYHQVNAITVTPGYVYAACQEGVLGSSDDGASWNLMNTGFPAFSFAEGMAVSGQYLLVGISGKGVWRRPLADLTAAEGTGAAPVAFALHQNYPNPCNPGTYIAFSLPLAGYAVLTVYNLLGEKVAELLNGWLPAGMQQVYWNAADSPSGVYYYELRAEGISAVKKCIVSK